MLKEKIDQMSCSENFKNIMKKVLFALAVIGLAVIVLLNLAACNGDNSDKSPNMPDDNGDTSIEQVQKTVGDILKTFDVTEPSIMDVAKDYVKSGEKLLSAKLNASGDLEMIFESGDNISCKTTDLPAGAQTLLSQDWQEYVLDKLGEKSLDKAIVGQDKIDSFKQRVSEAISDYKSAIKTLSGAETTLNTFGGGNFDDKGALKNIVSDDLLVYKYNSARKDDSFVIIGVDKQGNVIEYLVQMNELGTGDVYKRFVNGIEGGDYTIQRTTLDISKPYKQPAEREIVSFDDLYTSVFGKGFVFKPYKEVLEELAAKKLPGTIEDLLVSGFVDGKFSIYVTLSRNSGTKGLVRVQCNANNELKEALDSYKVLEELYGTDLFDTLVKSYNKNFVKQETIEQTKKELEEIFKKTKSKDIIEKIEEKDLSSSTIIAINNQVMEQNLFGEQYLKVAGKTDAQLISTYVGAMSTKIMDATEMFDTGCACFFDLSVLYKENNDVKVYKTQVAVPWYTNSTNDSLYNSFLTDRSYKLRNESTNVIQNANLLTELPNNNEKEINLNNFKQEVYIDDDKRLA